MRFLCDSFSSGVLSAEKYRVQRAERNTYPHNRDFVCTIIIQQKDATRRCKWLDLRIRAHTAEVFMQEAFIVDDHADTAEAFCLMLQSAGFKANSFADFDNALAHIISDHPCIVFVD